MNKVNKAVFDIVSDLLKGSGTCNLEPGNFESEGDYHLMAVDYQEVCDAGDTLKQLLEPSVCSLLDDVKDAAAGREVSFCDLKNVNRDDIVGCVDGVIFRIQKIVSHDFEGNNPPQELMAIVVKPAYFESAA